MGADSLGKIQLAIKGMEDHSSMYLVDGTLRACPLAKTIAHLKDKLSNVGITRVANVTGLDNVGIPVATAIRPNAKHLTTSQGKGLSWGAAWISAVMEAIEAFHAENPVATDVFGSYLQLMQHYPVLDPNQFAPAMFTVPSLQHWPCAWIEATHLLSHKTCLMPKALITLDSTVHMPDYSLFSVNSNGLAAGNTLDEAICHALFELIERDAISTWTNLNSDIRQTTKINLATIQTPVIRQLIAQLEQANQEVKIWDATSAHGIPVYQCTVSDKHLLRGLGIFRGSGCHALNDVAIMRAITEAAQSRLTLISGSRDDIFPSYYHANKKLHHQPTPAGTRDYQQIDAISIPQDFEALKQWILQRLTEHGVNDIYMVNHTKPELDIPVVHLLAPTLTYHGSRI